MFFTQLVQAEDKNLVVMYQTFLWVQAAEASLQSQDEEQNRSHEA